MTVTPLPLTDTTPCASPETVALPVVEKVMAMVRSKLTVARLSSGLCVSTTTVEASPLPLLLLLFSVSQGK